MALLKIKKYPEEVLKKRAEDVKEITPEIMRLIEDMKETMKKTDGVGLAAPQVGISKRLIVMETKKGPVALINPKILKKSRDVRSAEEGCLSLPGIYFKVKRPRLVEVEALDIDGNNIHLGRNEGEMLSRILQHEIDHLNGILIINRIPFWQRLKIRKTSKFTEARSLSERK